MKVGTKSLLFGAHQFLIHPLFVFIAWWRLFGFPADVRLWAAFIVHDWGYWQSPEMDGPVGKMHPELGGRLMARWFGPEWGAFTWGHSRSYARLRGVGLSPLCAADKLATAIEPLWLYLFRVLLTGEWREYMEAEHERPNDRGGLLAWVRSMRVSFREEAERLGGAYGYVYPGAVRKH